MKALSFIPLLFSLIFISCGSDSKPAATTNDTTNTIAASLETAKSELRSALPNPQASTEMALLQDKGFYALELVEHTDYGENMDYLGLPGGCGRGDGEGWAENSPRDYLYYAMDPDYACTEDNNVVSREDEPDEFAPTVFARFEEELFIVEFIQDIVTMQNNVIIPDTYTGTFEMEGHTVVISIEVEDYGANDHFDSKFTAIGSPQGSDEVFIYSRVFVKFSEGITRLSLFDDCRNASDNLGCEEEHGNNIGWSYFSHNSNNGKLVYEYSSLQENGRSELQRIFRGADTQATTLAHFMDISDNDADFDEYMVVLAHGTEGSDSDELSVSMYLTNETHFYNRENCIDANNLNETESNLCSGSPALDASDTIENSALNWSNRNAIVDLLFGDDLGEAGVYFSDFNDATDFYSDL